MNDRMEYAPSLRRHDLDALRASAMLLGIVYHVALSFASGMAWMAQDVSQSRVPYVFQAFVHGFRMPLFMLVSGFFTAMLWRKRGTRALLWHRFRRVLLPCLLGLITVVPAMIWSSTYAIQAGISQRQKAVLSQSGASDLWGAIRQGDVSVVRSHLQQGIKPGILHPEYGITPLTWAALTGQRDIAVVLLQNGAEVNGRNRDGGTALHAAAFLGREDIVRLLIEKGADVNVTSSTRERPLQSAAQDWPVVQYISGILTIPVDKAQVEAGRERVVKLLREAGAAEGPRAAASSEKGTPASNPSPLQEMYQKLVDTPVFILVWFLWFLWWLVVVFGVGAWIVGRLGWKLLPGWVILSPLNLLWLVPLTMIPTWFMVASSGPYGPDISMGIIPMPRVFIYYALFFFFGAFYHGCDDKLGILGRSWRWTLPVAMLVVFPVGLELAIGTFGFRDRLIPARYQHAASVALQVLYAWMMSLGCIGMFRTLLVRENKTIRYLSDSSYWLYLSHLPLTIVLQSLISDWPLPWWVKLPFLSIVLVGFLLLTYDKLIRYTWVGKMLNGPRTRPAKQTPLIAPAERSMS